MRTLKILVWTTAAAALFLVGCGNNSDNGVEPQKDPLLAVNATEIDLAGSPLLDQIIITNAGGGQLQWDIQEKPDWLEVSELVGRVTDDTAVVRITTNFNELEYGVYEGVIKIHSNGGDVTITIRLEYKAPKLKIENPVVNMDRHYSRSELVIINEGGGELQWWITQAPGWLKFEISMGFVYAYPQHVPFQVKFNSLDYGFYEDKIKIESNDGAAEITVYLTYEREIEVYPGVGAAYVELGDTYNMVKKQWGDPDRNWYDRPEKTLFIHHFTYDDVGLHFAVKTNSLILYGTGKVGYIEVYPPYDGMTEELLGIGSTVDELKTAYGDPASINGDKWYYDIGITFVIRNNKINGMIIKDPDF